MRCFGGMREVPISPFDLPMLSRESGRKRKATAVQERCSSRVIGGIWGWLEGRSLHDAKERAFYLKNQRALLGWPFGWLAQEASEGGTPWGTVGKMPALQKRNLETRNRKPRPTVLSPVPVLLNLPVSLHPSGRSLPARFAPRPLSIFSVRWPREHPESS